MLKKEAIQYSDGDCALEGFAAHPEGEMRPLVILCHAWRGLDDFICEKAERIAELGFAAFAIDMYGKGILGKNPEENAALKKPFLNDRSLLQQRLLKGYKTASALHFADASRIVALGYGFGAVCALDLARSGVPLHGAISVYGHFDPPKNIPKHPIKSKILILHGYNDPVAPLSELRAFENELVQQKVDWQTCLYGHTYHAFATPTANDASRGILYNPVSAKRSWQAIVNFLQEA